MKFSTEIRELEQTAALKVRSSDLADVRVEVYELLAALAALAFLHVFPRIVAVQRVTRIKPSTINIKTSGMKALNIK